MNMREMTIGDVFKAILNHIGLVVGLPFIAVVCTVVLCYKVLPPTYTATSTMYVLNRSNEEIISQSDLSGSLLLVNDYQELAKSDRVMLNAAQTLGIDENNLEDNFKVEVTAENNTRLISIKVTNTDAAVAANMANAITTELAQCILDVMQAENISIVDAATPPSEPSGPKSLQNTAIAGVAALLIAVGIALLIEMLNTKIKTAEDVENVLGIPVLAQIPRFEDSRRAAKNMKKGKSRR